MARYACPRCGSGNLWVRSDGRRRCSACRHTFSVSDGRVRLTPYWKGRLTEFFALGVPAYRLRHRLEGKLSQPTVQRFFNGFRELVYEAEMPELERLSGILELDESAFGGRRHGNRGWGAEGKTVVFGIYKRNGKVRVFPLSARKAAEILPLVEAHTSQGSLYYTDEWQAYASLSTRGGHVVVKKERGRPKGRDHVNGIEGFWSYAKTFLAQYRGVPRDKFPLYLKECEWRFNHRDEDLVPLLRKLLQGSTA